MLDEVIDTNGNTMTFSYEKEQNYYQVAGLGNYIYDRNADPLEILYGANTTPGVNTAATAGVLFVKAVRCVDANGNNVTSQSNCVTWPDGPLDLNCDTFRRARRRHRRSGPPGGSDRLETYVSNGSGGWTIADSYQLSQGYPDPDPARTVTPSSGCTASSTPATTLPGRTRSSNGRCSSTRPSIARGPRAHGRSLNRIDNNPSQGIPPMKMWRLSQIDDELGGR